MKTEMTISEKALHKGRLLDFKYAGIPGIPIADVTLLRSWNEITRTTDEEGVVTVKCEAFAGMKLDTIEIFTVAGADEERIMKTEKANIPFIYDPAEGCINAQAFDAVVAYIVRQDT